MSSSEDTGKKRPSLFVRLCSFIIVAAIVAVICYVLHTQLAPTFRGDEVSFAGTMVWLGAVLFLTLPAKIGLQTILFFFGVGCMFFSQYIVQGATIFESPVASPHTVALFYFGIYSLFALVAGMVVMFFRSPPAFWISIVGCIVFAFIFPWSSVDYDSAKPICLSIWETTLGARILFLKIVVVTFFAVMIFSEYVRVAFSFKTRIVMFLLALAITCMPFVFPQRVKIPAIDSVREFVIQAADEYSLDFDF